MFSPCWNRVRFRQHQKHNNNTIKQLVESAKSESDNHLMHDDISDHEVMITFGKGSDCSGPDGISAKLIDNAERHVMHECLKILWNRIFMADYRTLGLSIHYQYRFRLLSQ